MDLCGEKKTIYPSAGALKSQFHIFLIKKERCL